MGYAEGGVSPRKVIISHLRVARIELKIAPKCNVYCFPHLAYFLVKQGLFASYINNNIFINVTREKYPICRAVLDNSRCIYSDSIYSHCISANLIEKPRLWAGALGRLWVYGYPRKTAPIVTGDPLQSFAPVPGVYFSHHSRALVHAIEISSSVKINTAIFPAAVSKIYIFVLSVFSIVFISCLCLNSCLLINRF